MRKDEFGDINLRTDAIVRAEQQFFNAQARADTHRRSDRRILSRKDTQAQLPFGVGLAGNVYMPQKDEIDCEILCLDVLGITASGYAALLVVKDDAKTYFLGGKVVPYDLMPDVRAGLFWDPRATAGADTDEQKIGKNNRQANGQTVS